MKSLLSKRSILIIGTAAVLATSGVAYGYMGTQATETSSSSNTQSVGTTSSDEIDWSSLPTTEVTLTNEALDITEAGTYILSGSSTANVTVNSSGNVRLILNGVSITSNDGAAIVIAAAENAVIELAEGSENNLEDSSNRSDEEIDGALYSADDLTLQGTGSLTITANYADGIVGKDDLTIAGGTYAITATDDGIRGKDSTSITDGTITIDAKGDGIKATNDTDADKGYIYIDGGNTTITSGDDAIKAYNSVTIDDGTVEITDSVEGIEASTVEINGGKISIYASDDGVNAVSETSSTANITINGGTITVEVGSGDTDAFDANGDIIVNGGTVTVTAPGMSSFDYDGSGELNGGTVTINGEQVSELPAAQMGGGGGGMAPR